MINACISHLGKTRALHPADGLKGSGPGPRSPPKSLTRRLPCWVLAFAIGFLVCAFAGAW